MKAYAPEICLVVGVFAGLATHQIVDKLFASAPKPQAANEWSMVYSNGVPCPVAIARVVNFRMEQLAVDWHRFVAKHSESLVNTNSLVITQ